MEDTELKTVTPENDEYAYLNRDFSSENFKIEIKNLPRYYGHNEIRKLLNVKLKLKTNKIKTPKRNSPYAYACFNNEEDRQNAMKILTGYTWKKKVLHAVKAKPAPDPLVKKRKEEACEDAQNKRIKIDDTRSPEERVKSSTIPWADIPYKDQLTLKQEEIKLVLKKIAKYLCIDNPELSQWIEKQKAVNRGYLCKLLDVKFAEQYDGYRNKCEFSIGIEEETKLRSVGFRLGSYAEGSTGIGPIEGLRHINNVMKRACKKFQEFVRSSKLQVFDPEIQTGHFRQFSVRTAKDQLMLIIGIHPQDLSVEELKTFKKDLVDYFSEGDGKEMNVTSLYYEAITKKKAFQERLNPEHLWGDTHLEGILLDTKFKISPEAFFQVNYDAAEVLYKTVIELANPTEKTTILDVCCGTGTIGICFSKSSGQVLGLEVVPEAIVDAKENAIINNVQNAEFFEGKAEDILGTVCYRSHPNNEIIAIVDPPRGGLHQKAVIQLRKIEKIKKVIFISCNPKECKNFLDLGRPESKALGGSPFVPTKAVAVDMFPHTKHCELVIVFERWNDVKLRDEVKEENVEATEAVENVAVTEKEENVEATETKDNVEATEIKDNVEATDKEEKSQSVE